MGQQFLYDGEARASQAPRLINRFAAIGGVAMFIFCLWGGGEFITNFVEKAFDMPPFISHFLVAGTTWITLLVIGYTYRQFTVIVSIYITIPLAVATGGIIGQFVRFQKGKDQWLWDFAQTHDLGLGILGIEWIILFTATILVVGLFFRRRGYRYD